MKLKYYLLAVLSAVALSSCYDDKNLWNEINSQEERIAALENWQKVVNSNIEALQTLVNTSDFVTGVTPIILEGEPIGYTMTFKNSPPVSIYNGSDGKDGENGHDGLTPAISLTQSEDGNWYWTLNGNLMTDSQGNPIQANGNDGKDGQPGEDGKDGQPGEDGKDGQPGEDGKDGQPGEDGKDGQPGEDGKNAPIPLLRIGKEVPPTVITDMENNPISPNAFYLSVDGGNTWARVSGKDGNNGVPGYSPFTSVTDKGDYIEIKMQDGTTLKLYKESQMKVVLETAESGVIERNSSKPMIIPYTIENPECDSWIQFEGTNGLIVLENDDNTITLVFDELLRQDSRIIISVIRNNKVVSKSKIEVVFSTLLSELTGDYFQVTPKVLEAVGGKVHATINGTFPELWFDPQAVVKITPVLRWNGGAATGQSEVFQGEAVKGNDNDVPFHEGKKYTMKSSFDYVPEMAKSELYLDFKITKGEMEPTTFSVKIADGVISTS